MEYVIGYALGFLTMVVLVRIDAALILRRAPDLYRRLRDLRRSQYGRRIT